MFIPRTLSQACLQATDQFPVLLLTGPRQVGKTTLLQHLCGDSRHYVSLDDPNIRTLANDDPSLFFQRFEPPLLIDEIQYAPGLLPQIKMMVDQDRKPGRFWLTGSQQFQMMKGVSESLAGRVAILNLLGFSQRERHQLSLDVPPFLPTRESIEQRSKDAPKLDLQSLYSAIWMGSYPAINAGPVTDRDLFYSSYVQTYLQRDVRDLTQVGDEARFLRFVRACAARTAQMLNLTELARDADIAVNTAKNWLSILQASFQVYLLQPFSNNITKRIIKTPKLYFLDTGLAAYLTEWSSPQTLEAGAMAGPMLETFVCSELLKSWWHRGKQPQLYYYRDKQGREIDFLLFQDQKAYPIEVKKSASPKADDAKHFSLLPKLGLDSAAGAVLCLTEDWLPLTKEINASPIGLL